MYQERLGIYLKKMLEHMRHVLQFTSRTCYNLSGTSCKLPQEDVGTYETHLATYIKNIICTAMTRSLPQTVSFLD